MNDAKPIWIDLDNTPHVPFFRPIIDALQREGRAVVVTARDAFSVEELVRLHEVDCKMIGRHFGRHKAMKVFGLGIRTGQLTTFIARQRPSLAVSHGSRAQVLAAKVLRIASIVIADYEHARHVTRPDYMLVPEIIPKEAAGKTAGCVLTYPGIKEDVYASSLAPDASMLGELHMTGAEIIVTMRPPADEAHYHNPESDALFDAVLAQLAEDPRTRIVMLPRNERQKVRLERQTAHLLQSQKVIIPRHSVDGLNLVWHSDLVVSGGGTMNREAAALGVPVYSVFRGASGAVDRYLASEGRLVMLESAADARRKIVLAKRDRLGPRPRSNTRALDTIVAHILDKAGHDEQTAPLLSGNSP